jgi:hypothetical protein
MLGEVSFCEKKELLNIKTINIKKNLSIKFENTILWESRTKLTADIIKKDY